MFFFLKLKKKLFLPPFLPAPYLWTEWDTYKTTTLLDSQANGIAWEISMNIVFCLNRTYIRARLSNRFPDLSYQIYILITKSWNSSKNENRGAWPGAQNKDSRWNLCSGHGWVPQSLVPWAIPATMGDTVPVADTKNLERKLRNKWIFSLQCQDFTFGFT